MKNLIQFIFKSSIVVFFFLLTGCAHYLQVIKFQDVQKQKLVKNRAVLKYDVDLSPLLEIENAMPENIVTIKSNGKVYISAVGFSNLYYIEPHNGEKAKFHKVKLKREQVSSFSKVRFDWAEDESVSFNWEDQEGAHINVINKKGKVS